jgi:glycosyltransferase involved in cell wall biosynthesis
VKKIFDSKNPPVTIVLPVYNGDKTLQRCLDSIEGLNGVESLQIIILDNCSTDNSFGISIRYASKSRFTVNVLQNEKNIGFLKSLKKILSISKTQFSLLLGCDDFIGKNYFMCMNGISYDYKNTAIITSRVISFSYTDSLFPHHVVSRNRYDGIYNAKYIIKNFNNKNDFGLAFLGLLNTKYFNSLLFDSVLLSFKNSIYLDQYLKGAFADIYSTLNVFGLNKDLELIHVNAAKVYKGVTKGSVGHESGIRDGKSLNYFEYLDMCNEVYTLSLPRNFLYVNSLAFNSLIIAYYIFIKKLIFTFDLNGFRYLIRMTKRTLFYRFT